jgi:hypothetical protein
MSDQYRKLTKGHYHEWKNTKATDYMENQRAAFIAGFEAAASEAEEFRELRKWLEEERDKAKSNHDDGGDKLEFARYMAFVDVLIKLSEMGCESTSND